MAIAFISSTGTTASGTSATINCAVGATIAVGSDVFVSIDLVITGGGSVTSVTDSQGNSYTKLGTANAECTLWHSKVVTQLTVADNVTVHITNPFGFTCFIAMGAYSGATGLGTVTTVGVTSPLSISQTLSFANNFLIAAVADTTASTATASSGTIRSQVGSGTRAAVLMDNTAASTSSVSNAITDAGVAVSVQLLAPPVLNWNQTGSTSGSSLVFTPSTPVLAGDALVIEAGTLNASNSAISISDSLNGPWIPGITSYDGLNTQIRVFYMMDAAAGSPTITITYGGGGSQNYYGYYDFSGPISGTDGAVASSYTTSTLTPTSGTFSTSTADVVVCGAFNNHAGGTINASTGFTLGNNASAGTNLFDEYKIQSAAGSVSPGFTVSGAFQGAIASQAFGLASAVTVTSIALTEGPSAGGASVTITGTGFSSGAAVYLGNPATSVVVVNSTTITCVTPTGSGTVNVTVVNTNWQGGTLFAGYTFSPASTVSTITPNQGSTVGGLHVTITGANFVAGDTVTIGGSPCTSVVIVNSTTITAVTGSHALVNQLTAFNVVVTDLFGQTGTLVNGFSYFSPSSAKIAPGGVLRPYQLRQSDKTSPFVNAQILTSGITSNVLGFSVNYFQGNDGANHIFQLGQAILLQNTAESFLNGQTIVITSITPDGTVFHANFTHADYSNPSEPSSALAEGQSSSPSSTTTWTYTLSQPSVAGSSFVVWVVGQNPTVTNGTQIVSQVFPSPFSTVLVLAGFVVRDVAGGLTTLTINTNDGLGHPDLVMAFVEEFTGVMFNGGNIYTASVNGSATVPVSSPINVNIPSLSGTPGAGDLIVSAICVAPVTTTTGISTFPLALDQQYSPGNLFPSTHFDQNCGGDAYGRYVSGSTTTSWVAVSTGVATAYFVGASFSLPVFVPVGSVPYTRVVNPFKVKH